MRIMPSVVAPTVPLTGPPDGGSSSSLYVLHPRHEAGHSRLRVGLCEARLRGMGVACGAPRYVFGAFGARSGRARLCVGSCQARLRGIGGACGDPAYVFGTLGRSRSVRNYVQGCIGG